MDKKTEAHTPTPQGPYLLPDLRCNNCLRYFREAEIGEIGCPDCKTDKYLMDMPEIKHAVNSHDALLAAAHQAAQQMAVLGRDGEFKGTVDLLLAAIAQAEARP